MTASSRRARADDGAIARRLPAKRWQRSLIYLAVTVAYVALMWFVVFPWADRTFVNRPGLEGTTINPTPTAPQTTTAPPTATATP